MFSMCRWLTHTGWLWAVVALMLSCARDRADTRLVAYVKAERALRQRIHDEQVLSDSLQILQKELNIELERDLEHILENPKGWIFLFNALEDTQ